MGVYYRIKNRGDYVATLKEKNIQNLKNCNINVYFLYNQYVPLHVYDLFETVAAHYLSSCYPDFQRHLETITKEEKAREMYLKTRKVFAWLKTLKP